MVKISFVNQKIISQEKQVQILHVNKYTEHIELEEKLHLMIFINMHIILAYLYTVMYVCIYTYISF